MKSDHFHPWWHDGGYGNFTWVWLAAAAERTKKMQFVTGVTAAVCRYNPGIIAQAFASLDVLHPGRISLGVGSGEAMNEVPLGFDWPDTRVKLARTTEAIQIIKGMKEKREKMGILILKVLNYILLPIATIFLSIWLRLVQKQLKLLQYTVMD